jgi:hypothetical protein
VRVGLAAARHRPVFRLSDGRGAARGIEVPGAAAGGWIEVLGVAVIDRLDGLCRARADGLIVVVCEDDDRDGQAGDGDQRDGE